jgi:hypothetical protein
VDGQIAGGGGFVGNEADGMAALTVDRRFNDAQRRDDFIRPLGYYDSRRRAEPEPARAVLHEGAWTGRW